MPTPAAEAIIDAFEHAKSMATFDFSNPNPNPIPTLQINEYTALVFDNLVSSLKKEQIQPYNYLGVYYIQLYNQLSEQPAQAINPKFKEILTKLAQCFSPPPVPVPTDEIIIRELLRGVLCAYAIEGGYPSIEAMVTKTPIPLDTLNALLNVNPALPFANFCEIANSLLEEVEKLESKTGLRVVMALGKFQKRLSEGNNLTLKRKATEKQVTKKKQQPSKKKKKTTTRLKDQSYCSYWQGQPTPAFPLILVKEEPVTPETPPPILPLDPTLESDKLEDEDSSECNHFG